MSKAFTRESDESPEEPVPALRAQLPPGTRNYITPEGAERLRERLQVVLQKKQKGDISDGEKRKTESEIREMQRVLESVVVAEMPAEREKVAFGARVVVRHEHGEEEAYRIVGIDETAPEQGSISWISPLARALISKRAGEKVRFRSPAGEEELTIVSVAY